jgi:hypothetical protein
MKSGNQNSLQKSLNFYGFVLLYLQLGLCRIVGCFALFDLAPFRHPLFDYMSNSFAFLLCTLFDKMIG